MKLLWRLSREAIRYKTLYVIAILSTLGLTAVNLAALSAAEGRRTLLWDLDPDLDVGRNQYGHEVALRPFMGVIGMPPADPGLHPTRPPRLTGGNIDCTELVAGSSLFLPVTVPGGLVSVGDGHAAQGDGEVGARESSARWSASS